MLPLSTDVTFHFEILRILAHARYGGADVAEVLSVASRIKPGDFDSWHLAWLELAQLVESSVTEEDRDLHPVSYRDAMFRASNYYRAADFYLHSNPNDPRIITLWEKQTACFDQAMALLPFPGERIMVAAADFTVPTIFYRAAGNQSHTKRPTLLIGSGFDGSQEELLHVVGFAALERGYNVISYDGPGQPTVVREQGLGFISQWEKVVTPVLDHYDNYPEVDGSKIALFGYSLGGELATRAGAFEERLAGLILVDGVTDFFPALARNLPSHITELLANGQHEAVDAALGNIASSPEAPSAVRWGFGHGMWAFKATSPAQYLLKVKEFQVLDVAKQIRCPTLVMDAESDDFFADANNVSQAQTLAGIIEKSTLIKLTSKEAGEAHCHVGAAVRLNQIVMDWFQDVVVQQGDYKGWRG
ncbi:Alpha/Beta hydrolase protein [Xylogone sp. PMI_703]|nr:Alpha/Beta hydrolase protein [Xylogone sp. PMI_703]